MARRVFTLVDRQVRARAANAIAAADEGSVVTIGPPKRTSDQNALWWPLLTEISAQAVHPVTGGALSPEVWRLILLDALGMETPPSVRSLDGSHDVPIGLSSSKLDKRTFTDLIELTLATGAELGVIFPTGGRETGEAKNLPRAAA